MEIENKKSLKKALEQPIDWGKYDKAAEPVIDIDLSLCTDEERPRMVAIVNRLAKSPAGRETLQIAADAGYKFGFLDAKTNCFGCCFGGMNCIGVAQVLQVKPTSTAPNSTPPSSLFNFKR